MDRMQIGFDGKRAFQNRTGLGNYSRSLLQILAHYYPQHQYQLFAPKTTNLFDTNDFPAISTHTPNSWLGKKWGSWWRRSGMVADIEASSIQLFHGLSNELPNGIKRTGKKSVVTVHDLIFERYPETYHWDEIWVHRKKIKQACKEADLVIAISEQTRQDLVDIYHIASEKIRVCYQSCNPIFAQTYQPDELETVRLRYSLPEQYFLFVGSVAPRKNLLTICKAITAIKDQLQIPLVVIGNGKKEKQEAIQWMKLHGCNHLLIFLNELPAAKELAFINGIDFPAIYQLATALVYPSLFEGFGLPILEALWSRLPVICSAQSSMPEVAGEAALYFEPLDHLTLSAHLLTITHDNGIAQSLTSKGIERTHLFTDQQYASNMMAIYQSLL